MKKNNIIKIGDAISQILKEENLDVKMSRYSVRKNWEEIAGKLLANHTTDIYFDNASNIFVTIDSSVIKNELMYSKEKLLAKINTYCGYELVKKIVLK